jgi:hypothetical protein
MFSRFLFSGRPCRRTESRRRPVEPGGRRASPCRRGKADAGLTRRRLHHREGTAGSVFRMGAGIGENPMSTGRPAPSSRCFSKRGLTRKSRAGGRREMEEGKIKAFPSP